jgi:AraC-like DNA-binding protein/mannose-6-phosphate isomerase-like protein (cupin superfamily)
MDWSDGRIVVMRPDALAAATVVDASHDNQGKDGTELIAGHDTILFVAAGTGTYRIGGHEGVMRPNTLIAAPAGEFACSLSPERELYIISTRAPAVNAGDDGIFTPFVAQQLSVEDGARWHARMADAADRAAAGRFSASDVARLRSDARPYVWRHESHKANDLLHDLISSVWERLATPLSLERLAADVGYTANYLNDLMREHTGRSLGRWVTDMRMARARATLERTDAPIADVASACGYDDPAYFSRAFRRAHGVPPATWRIAARPVDARHSQVAIPIDVLHEYELRHNAPERAYSFAS